MNKIIGAVVGVVVGLGIGYWWLSPAKTVDQLRVEKIALISNQQKAEQAIDDAALEGVCDAGSWKALPSGQVAVCADTRTWSMPKAPSNTTP